LNLLDRRSALLVAHIDALREAVRRTRLRSPVSMPGSFCPTTCIACGRCRQAMPTSPVAGARLKIAFPKSWPKSQPRSPVMTRRVGRGTWQRRYWEHTIRDERDFAAHMDYTHFNPAPPHPHSSLPASGGG
jgi:putative transposase